MVCTLKLCLSRGFKTKLGDISYLGIAFWVCSICCVYLFASKQNIATNVNPVTVKKKGLVLNGTISTSHDATCKEKVSLLL